MSKPHSVTSTSEASVFARAASDLVEIGDYIRAESPQGARRVRDAIMESLTLALNFPLMGRRQSIGGVRKLVTRRYRYVVYYTLDEAAGELVVLSIQHPKRSSTSMRD